MLVTGLARVHLCRSVHLLSTIGTDESRRRGDGESRDVRWSALCIRMLQYANPHRSHPRGHIFICAKNDIEKGIPFSSSCVCVCVYNAVKSNSQ